MSTVVALDGSSLNYGPANETTVAQPSVSRSRFCIGCQCPIPANRMKANPKATSCVPCLEAAGDVAPLRRLTEQASYNRAEVSNDTLSGITEAPLLQEPHHMRSHEQLSNEIIDSISRGSYLHPHIGIYIADKENNNGRP